MWSLIIISHILMAVSFFMLSLSSIKGHFVINEFGAFSLTFFAIFSIMIYAFTQSLVLFLIIAINKNIKNLISDNQLSIEDPLYSSYKYKMHMHTSLNLLFMITLGILFAGVHTGLMNETTHNTLFIIGTIHYVYVIYIQYHCFKQIIKLIVRVNDMIMHKL
tara:strand:- start:307 stop:792 length:486 start_codon:yes stop_codon:yes gene_type:complete